MRFEYSKGQTDIRVDPNLLGAVEIGNYMILVDGEPAPILPSYHLFRGVFAPAGRHRIDFEYEPPPDVEGPGLAFSDKKPETTEPGDEAAHDEARRLARLLVSEIQLYNQEEVSEGRSRGDIYERLKDDIDRSRQLYEERVDPEIRDSTDYFYQELVRQLGAGDAKALGI